MKLFKTMLLDSALVG